MSQREYSREDFGQGGLNSQLDAESLVADIGLDRDEIGWRKDFIGFGREDVRRLKQYEGMFRENAEQIADDFYDNLTDYEQTVEVIGRSPKNVDQLKRTQSAYLVSLANGDYGADYFEDRARIGKLHDLLDMPMKHYLGQYGVYYDLILPLTGDRLTESLVDRLDGQSETGTQENVGRTREQLTEIVQEEVDDAVRDILALLRIINLDMQVVTDTYIHSYTQDIEETLEQQRRVATESDRALTTLRSSAEDISQNVDRVSDLADEQVDNSEQVASEVASLSGTVEEVASSADEVARNSERAADLADDGLESVETVDDVMSEVDTASQEVRGDMDALQDAVDEIEDIVEVINDIADRTNMLALNASIEAARADEGGDGFTVVAEEVKQLAEESQTHAKDAEEVIERVRSTTDATLDSLTETERQIDRGVTETTAATESLEEIADAVESVAAGIEEISAASDEQASSAEEIASMADRLQGQSDDIAVAIDEIATATQEQLTSTKDIEQSIEGLASDASGTPAEAD